MKALVAIVILLCLLAWLVVRPILQERHVAELDAARRETQVILNALAYAYDFTRESENRLQGDSIAIEDLVSAAREFRPGSTYRISIDWFENARQKGIHGLDGWQRPLELVNRNGNLCVSSAGADGISGTEDDMFEVLARGIRADGLDDVADKTRRSPSDLSDDRKSSQ